MFRRSLDGLVRGMARLINSFAFIWLFLLSTVVAVPNVGGRSVCRKCKKTPAATGYKKYCKRCYKEMYPRLYLEKLKARKKGCVVCGEVLELNKQGVCKPCRCAGRICSLCGDINKDAQAAICPHCKGRRQGLGATRARLSVWCKICTTDEDRSRNVCFECIKIVPSACHHCGGKGSLDDRVYSCSEKRCRSSVRFCLTCVFLVRSEDKLLCKTCWRASGRLCVYCNVGRGRDYLKSLRSCHDCTTKLNFCMTCFLPPPKDFVSAQCRLCTESRPWCTVHFSSEQVESKLCNAHFKEFRNNTCSHCRTAITDGALVASACKTVECSKEILACSTCVTRAGAAGLQCRSCWNDGEQKCIICHDKPAQSSLDFKRCCRFCFSNNFAAEETALVEEESRAYLDGINDQQTWGGHEPALQLLRQSLFSSTTLPEYSSQAEYLSPSHCRLCLEAVAPGDMDQHLQARHECTSSEYREFVLRKVLADWPQSISPQVLRSCLAAFKEELCDKNFEQMACASCCRLKRKSKLTMVAFERRGSMSDRNVSRRIS